MDKKKVYIGLEIGNSFIARTIQYQTNEISGLSGKETASHVLACVDNYVYESHFPCGVKKYTVDEYTSKNKTVFWIDFSLNTSVLESHVKCRTPYGNWDIFTKVLNLFEKNNGPGLICSEYIDHASDFIFSKHFVIASHEVTPAHIQAYFKEKKVA